MKKFTFILIVLMSVTFTIEAQKTIYGTVVYDFIISGEGAEALTDFLPSKMIMQFGEQAVSVRIEGGSFSDEIGKTVINGASGELFTIKYNTKTVYLDERENEEDSTTSEAATDLTEWKETKKILGYKCRKYTYTSENDVLQTLWITKKLTAPDYMNSELFKGLMQQGGLNIVGDGFPMSAEGEVSGTEFRLELTVSKLDLTPVDPAEFEKPEGFTVLPYSDLEEY